MMTANEHQQGSFGQGAPAEPFRDASLADLLLLGLLFVVFSLPALGRLVSAWSYSGDFSHGFLAPFVAAAAAWRVRGRWAGARPAPSWLGVALLGAGAVVVLLGHWYGVALAPSGMGTPFLCGMGLVVCAVGVVAAAKGWPAVGACAFPLGYLLFAVPIPDDMAGMVTLPLRRLVTAVSEALVRGMGISVLREGNVLHLPVASLGVDDACSGIRSLWTLLAAALAMGWFLDLGKARMALLCALAAPMAVAGNVLRVVATAALAVWAGPEFAGGWRHEAVGWLAFGASVAMMLGAAWALAPRPGTRACAPPAPGVGEPFSRSGQARAAMAAAVLTAGIVAVYTASYHYAVKARSVGSGRRSLAEFPRSVGGFTAAKESALTDAEWNMLTPTDQLQRLYYGAKGAVEVVLMYWEPGAAGGPHSPDVCMTYSGWVSDPRWSQDKPLAALAGRQVSYRLWRLAGREMAMVFWRRRGGLDLVWPGGEDLAQRWRALLRSWNAESATATDYHYVRLLAPIRPGTHPTEVFRLLEDLIEVLAPLLPEYGFRLKPIGE